MATDQLYTGDWVSRQIFNAMSHGKFVLVHNPFERQAFDVIRR